MCVCVCCNAHRKALEAKAALYDHLCRGEGLRRVGSDDSEGGEEEEGDTWLTSHGRLQKR